MPGFAFVEHPWSRVADWCFGMIGRGLLQRVLYGRVGAATTCVVEGATTDASASASAGDSTSSTLTKPHATIHRDVLIPPPAPTDPPREPPHKDPSLVDDDPFSWGRIAGVYVTSAAWIDVMARTLGGGGNGGRGSDDHGDRRTREWHEMAT